jgi:short-subunit dehydrogenase
MSEFAEKYGPWAVVAGASVGIGAEFCRQIAAEGVNVVLVSRSADKLNELASELRDAHGVETRVAAADLAVPGAESELFAATEGLELGLFVYNAGADTLNTYFLNVPAEEWHAMVRRNCVVPLLASHHYGAEMVARGCGGILLVTSGAAWAGGGRLTTYGGTKAFDLVFAEGLWAELRRDGVDVLSLVVGATDTPSLRGSLEKFGVSMDDLSQMSEVADPADVARAGLTHLGDGPTWQVGVEDGGGPSLLGSLPRRQAVELITQGHDMLFGDG